MLQDLGQKLQMLLGQLAPEEVPSDKLTLPLATAILLFEVAWADHDVSATEEVTLAGALASMFALTDSEVAELLTRSREHQQNSVGVYPYTRLLNESLQAAEKQELLVHLWSLALADDVIDQFEEHRIRSIADLLYISHPDFIAAKHQAKREQG